MLQGALQSTFGKKNLLLTKMSGKFGYSQRLAHGVDLAYWNFVDLKNKTVESMNSGEKYTISRQFPFFWKYSCTCADYKYRHEEVGYCKHIYAYLCKKLFMKGEN